MDTRPVAYAHSVGAVGGAERVSLSLMSCERVPSVLFSPPEGGLAEEALGLEVTCYPLSEGLPDLKRPIATIAGWVGLWRGLRNANVGLIHTGDILAFRALQPLTRLLSLPTVCHVHFPYEASFLRWVFGHGRQPDVFLYCSDELQRAMEPLLTPLCPASAHVVIHNGVDTQRFTSRAVPLQNSTVHIGIVANLQERKGHVEFLEMAKLLRQPDNTLRFHIIGGDILGETRAPELKALARHLGIDHIVTFHGQVADVPAQLASLDIVVCASHEEAFPLSILEAMAAARPIVATGVNGIPEAIDHGRSGLLVPARNPQALAAAVARLLSDRQSAVDMGQCAAKRVQARFGLEVFRKRVSELYKGLMHGEAE